MWCVYVPRQDAQTPQHEELPVRAVVAASVVQFGVGGSQRLGAKVGAVVKDGAS